MTDLDKAVLAARFEYRKAYRAWLAHKGSADVEKRIKVEADLQRTERELLSVARRER